MSDKQLSEKQTLLIKEHLISDRMLYDHFLAIFKDKISREIDLSGEVEEFRTILTK